MATVFQHPSGSNFCRDFKDSCSLEQQEPPACFSSFPKGEEAVYNTWKKRWMELYGGVGASCELKNALIDYKKAVNCLQEDQKRMHEVKRENEKEEVEVMERQRAAYAKKRKAEEEVDEGEKMLKVTKDCLCEAEASFRKAIRSGSDHDKEVARVGLEIAEARFDRDKTSFQDAEEYVKMANKDIEESEKQLQTAKNYINVATRNTEKSMKRVNKAKLKVDRLVGFTEDLASATAPVTQPLVKIVPKPNAEPSSTKQKRWRELPFCFCNVEALYDICELQRNVTNLPRWAEYSHVPAPRENNRNLTDEADMHRFFREELEPRIINIMQTICPNASLTFVSGMANKHADIFLHLKRKDSSGVWRQTFVVVELKSPYGSEKSKTATSCRSVSRNSWMRACNFPKPGLVRKGVKQAVNYATNARISIPDEVRGKINPSHTILSTFNDTWMVEIRRVKKKKKAFVDIIKGMNRSRTEQNNQENETDHSYKEYSVKTEAYVSQAIKASFEEPHVAFAYAWVLKKVYKDMWKNPHNYEIYNMSETE